MLSGRFTLAGSVMLAAGMLIVALAVGVSGDLAPRVLAGPPPTPTPVATQRPKTHTPTSTATAAATSTAVPATQAPVNTQAPAPTQPSGGAGGAVTAPNTGDGGASGRNSAGLWLLLGGIAVAATGAGAVLVGVRRRS